VENPTLATMISVMTIPIMHAQQQQMRRATESPIASACCPADSVEFVLFAASRQFKEYVEQAAIPSFFTVTWQKQATTRSNK
jgi:hypothetical protein